MPTLTSFQYSRKLLQKLCLDRHSVSFVRVYVRTSSPTTATVHTEAQATVPTAIIQRKGMAPSKDGFSGAYMRMSTARKGTESWMDKNGYVRGT
jgi:hypothetical protein